MCSSHSQDVFSEWLQSKGDMRWTHSNVFREESSAFLKVKSLSHLPFLHHCLSVKCPIIILPIAVTVITYNYIALALRKILQMRNWKTELESLPTSEVKKKSWHEKKQLPSGFTFTGNDQNSFVQVTDDECLLRAGSFPKAQFRWTELIYKDNRICTVTQEKEACTWRSAEVKWGVRRD